MGVIFQSKNAAIEVCWQN